MTSLVTTRQYQSTPVAHNAPSQPVFSGISQILRGKEFAHQRFDKPLADVEDKIKAYERRTSSPPYSTHKLRARKFWLKFRQMLGGQFLDFDFTDFNYYKGFGKLPFHSTFTNPSRGALIAFAFIGLEGARALRAWNRRWIKDGEGKKIKQDFRELRDVLIRDTWAIAVYIWGLTLANSYFLRQGQKAAGFNLARGGHAFDFKAHEINRDFRNLDDKTGQPLKTFRRRTYVANILHGDGIGMIRAAQKNTLFGIPREIYQRVKASTPKVKAQLDEVSQLISEFRNKQKSFYNKVSRYIPSHFEKDSNFEKLIDNVDENYRTELYNLLDSKGKGKNSGLLRQLDDLQQSIIQSLSTSPEGQVDGALKARLNKKWGRFSSFFVRAAKGKRTAMDALSFGFILFLIGYLPVKFNEWFTNAEYKRMQEDQRRYQGMALTLKNTQQPLHHQPTNPVQYTQRAAAFGQG